MLKAGISAIGPMVVILIVQEAAASGSVSQRVQKFLPVAGNWVKTLPVQTEAFYL
jgi:hypothetical protein